MTSPNSSHPHNRGKELEISFPLFSAGVARMSVMIFTLSMMSLVLGTSFACAAPRVPAHAVRFEQWGGTLFVSGLTLLGAALPRLC
jgi:hypothetical protein